MQLPIQMYEVNEDAESQLTNQEKLDEIMRVED